MKKLFVSLIAAQLLAGTGAVFAYDNPARDAAIQMMRHHDYDDALNKLNEAVGFNGTDPENFMLRGKCFFCMHNYALAIEDFNHTIEYSPNYYRAFLWRGTANARLGNDDLAVKDYEQAIRLHPEYAKAFFANQGHELPGHKAGSGGPAVDDYKQAMSMVYPTGYDPAKPVRTGSADPSAEGPTTPDEFLNETDASGPRAPQMVAMIKRRREDGTNVQVTTGGGDGSKRESGRESRRAQGEGPYQALQGNPAGTDLNTTNAGNTDIGRDDDRLDERRNRRVTSSMDVNPNFGKFGAVPGSQPITADPKKVIAEVTEAIRADSTNPDYFYMRAKAEQKLQDVNKAYADFCEAIRLFPKSEYYIGRASMFYQLDKPLLVDADIRAAIACDPTTPRTIHFGGDKYPSSVHWDGDGPGGK